MDENMNKREIVDNPEPDWSLAMFWEDITAIFIRLLDIIRSLFNYA